MRVLSAMRALDDVSGRVLHRVDFVASSAKMLYGSSTITLQILKELATCNALVLCGSNHDSKGGGAVWTWDAVIARLNGILDPDVVVAVDLEYWFYDAGFSCLYLGVGDESFWGRMTVVASSCKNRFDEPSMAVRKGSSNANGGRICSCLHAVLNLEVHRSSAIPYSRSSCVSTIDPKF
ncbi:hypothetical protein K469DRAFT_686777 [Zopfia rhizophila CBS 207.26]|uniref:Uncharacterized protein n=1 Tax=Zopfia rhizophila CBS 207.26 TaxID=1314779 RepID=A0A6A6EY29_9PEZI|nr:hypothetical protein K469DRAFT_686777 [Zopfia rhizophila CBS 207.26]